MFIFERRWHFGRFERNMLRSAHRCHHLTSLSGGWCLLFILLIYFPIDVMVFSSFLRVFLPSCFVSDNSALALKRFGRLIVEDLLNRFCCCSIFGDGMLFFVYQKRRGTVWLCVFWMCVCVCVMCMCASVYVYVPPLTPLLHTSLCTGMRLSTLFLVLLSYMSHWLCVRVCMCVCLCTCLMCVCVCVCGHQIKDGIVFS